MSTSDNVNLIFTAVDRLSGGVAAIEKRLKGVSAQVTAVDRAVGKLGRGFSMFGALVTGILQGVGIALFQTLERGIYRITRLIPDLIGKGEEWAKVIDEINDRTGIGAEKASMLAAAAKYVNVSSDSLVTGLTRLAKTVYDNETAFVKLGIATRNANGGQLDAYQLLTNIRQASSATGASLLTTAAAQKLLGRGAAELADLLQLTDAQFNAITADARRSGLIMSDAGVAAAETWERTKTRLDTVLTGIGVQVLNGVAPYLTQLVDGISNAIQQNLDKIVAFVVQVVNFLGGLISGLFGITIATTSFAGSLGSVNRAATGAGDGLDDYRKKQDKATSSTNKAIAAIDRQLRALDKAEQQRDAQRDRAELQAEIATLQGQLADLQGEAVFTAGMSAAEAELARQAQAQKIIDAATAVQDAKDRLAEHDHDEAVRRRREELQEERRHLQARQNARRGGGGGGGLRMPGAGGRGTGPVLNQGFLSKAERAIGLGGGGLNGSILQAAENARRTGEEIAASVREFVGKVGSLIDTLSPIGNALGVLVGSGPMGILALIAAWKVGGTIFNALVAAIATRLVGPGVGPGGTPPAVVPTGAGGIAATIRGLGMNFTGTGGMGALGGLDVLNRILNGQQLPWDQPMPDRGLNMWNQPNPDPSQRAPREGDVVNGYRFTGGRWWPDQGSQYTAPIGPTLSGAPMPSGVNPKMGPSNSIMLRLDDIARNTGRAGALGQGLGDLGVGTNRTADAAEDSAVSNAGARDALTTRIPIDPITGSKITVAGTALSNIISNTHPLSLLRFKDGKLSTTTVAGTKVDTNCFVAGTMISTPDGPKPIEQIAVGDKVLAFDEHTLEPGLGTVVAFLPKRDHREARVAVTLEDGRQFEVTTSHRFYTPNNRAWLPIGELVPGAQLYDGESRTAVRIAAMGWLGSEPTDVYNFTVDHQHTYLVAGGILVHNIKPPTNAQGLLGLTRGTTDVGVMGEAGTEAAAILRMPRAIRAGGGLSGGGFALGGVTERGTLLIQVPIDKRVVGEVALDYIVRDGRLSTSSKSN